MAGLNLYLESAINYHIHTLGYLRLIFAILTQNVMVLFCHVIFSTPYMYMGDANVSNIDRKNQNIAVNMKHTGDKISFSFG